MATSLVPSGSQVPIGSDLVGACYWHGVRGFVLVKSVTTSFFRATSKAGKPKTFAHRAQHKTRYALISRSPKKRCHAKYTSRHQRRRTNCGERTNSKQPILLAVTCFIRIVSSSFSRFQLPAAAMHRTYSTGSPHFRLVRKAKRARGLRAKVHADRQEIGRACRLAALAADAILDARRRCDLARTAPVPRDHLKNVSRACAHALRAADARVVDLHVVRHRRGSTRGAQRLGEEGAGDRRKRRRV